MEQNNRFDEVLRRKMEGFEAEPPVDMFARISSSVNNIETKTETPAESAPAGRSFNLRPLLRYASAAVVAVAAVATIMVLNRPVRQELTAEAVAEPQNTQPAKVEQIDLSNNTIAALTATDSESPTVAKIPTKKIVAAVVVSSDNVAPDAVQTTTTKVVKVDKITPAEQPSSNNAKKSAERKKNTKKIYTDEELEAYWREVLNEEQRGDTDLSRLSTTLYAGNLGVGRGDMTMSNVADDPMLVTEGTLHSAPQFGSLPSAAPSEGVTKLQHRMPLSVGLSVSYKFSETFAIESGLTYTNMFSASEKYSSLSGYQRRRDMHYIGIPLAATCRLFDISRVGFYMRVGGTIEKCVYAADRYYLDGVLNNTDKFTVDKPQLSIDASIGVQYPLWLGFSVYGEGGISYYFPSEAQPESYRTVNPLNASIRFGLRYSFL